MPSFMNANGSEPSKDKRALKVRLADTFRTPGQTMSEFMTEIKALTEKDLADFRGWFEAEGLPIL